MFPNNAKTLSGYVALPTTEYAQEQQILSNTPVTILYSSLDINSAANGAWWLQCGSGTQNRLGDITITVNALTPIQRNIPLSVYCTNGLYLNTDSMTVKNVRYNIVYIDGNIASSTFNTVDYHNNLLTSMIFLFILALMMWRIVFSPAKKLIQ